MKTGVAYDATKFAVRGMTKSAAFEYAEHYIRVNAVMPGFIETEMDADLDPGYLADIHRQTPLGRRASPAEVSALIVYLASDECQFQTAGEYVIDGGLTQVY